VHMMPRVLGRWAGLKARADLRTVSDNAAQCFPLLGPSPGHMRRTRLATLAVPWRIADNQLALNAARSPPPQAPLAP
jgi:hypothetical protein